MLVQNVLDRLARDDESLSVIQIDPIILPQRRGDVYFEGLRGRPIERVVTTVIQQAVGKPFVRHVSIVGCGAGRDAGLAIVDLIKQGVLETLDISFNSKIPSGILNQIFDAIKTNTTLTHLTLNGFVLNHSNTHSLECMMQANNVLRIIDHEPRRGSNSQALTETTKTRLAENYSTFKLSEFTSKVDGSLTELKLTSFPLGEIGLNQLISTLQRQPNLTAVSLIALQLTTVQLQRLMPILLSLEFLAKLNLHDNQLDDESLLILNPLFEFGRPLRSITLSENAFSSAENFFEEELKTNTWLQVVLFSTYSFFSGASGQAFRNEVQRNVYLAAIKSDFQTQGGKYFSFSGNNSAIVISNIILGDLGVKCVLELIGSGSPTQFYKINMIKVGMTAAGAKLFAEFLAKYPNIIEVSIDGNEVGDEGASYFAELIAASKTLSTFSAEAITPDRYNPRTYSCAISDDGMKLFADALKKNTSLRYFNVFGNPFGSLGAKAIGQMLHDNKWLTTVNFSGANVEPGGAKNALTEFNKRNFSIVDVSILLEKNFRTYKNVFQGYNNYDEGGPTKKVVGYTRDAHAYMTPKKKFINRNSGKRDDAILHAKDGKLSALRKAINDGISPYTADSNGNTLLHLVCMHGYVKCVQYLLELNCNRLHRNNNGLLALEVVAGDRKDKIVELLTSFHAAPKKRQRGLKDFFMQPKERGSSSGEPLKKRARTTQPEEHHVIFDIHKGVMPASVDPAYRDPRGQSLLHIAAGAGQFGLLEQMIEQFLDPNITDIERRTAIHTACASQSPGRARCVETLLSHRSIQLDLLDVYGLTPVYLIAGGFIQSAVGEDNDAVEIARLLIKLGASVSQSVFDPEFNTTMTALHKAIIRRQYNVAKIILAASDCDVNAQDGNGWTVLHWAVHLGFVEMVDRLSIETKINFQLTNNQNKIAAELSNDEAIQLCLGERMSEQKPTPSVGIKWVSDFAISYGSRYGKNKSTVVEGKMLHQNLRAIWKANHANKGNSVAASVTFIISSERHEKNGGHHRLSVPIILNGGKTFHVNDAGRDKENRVKERIRSAPEEILSLCTANPSESGKPLNIEGVEAVIRSRFFAMRFHHSEQSLFDYLSIRANIEDLVQSLRAEDRVMKGAKIYAVVLDTFSERYMCKNCEVSMLGFQHPFESRFLSQLSELLGDVDFVLPRRHPLRLITRMSADKPFGREKVEQSDHQDLTIDLRAQHHTLILERDVSEERPSGTMFNSRFG